jgi:hypothetical protein
MLEWQRDLLGGPEAGGGRMADPGVGRGAAAGGGEAPASRQVQVLIVPTGKIEQVQRGTTAGDIIRAKVRVSTLPSPIPGGRHRREVVYGPQLVCSSVSTI